MTLFNLIAWVETKCNFKSFRFEPATYAKILVMRSPSQKEIIQRIIDCNACSWNTALMVYCTSWGAVQIMGFNLYGPECQFVGTISDFLQNLSIPAKSGVNSSIVLSNQEQAFNRLILSMKLDAATPENLALHPALRRAFALTYNGSADYMIPLSEALTHYGVAVQG